MFSWYVLITVGLVIWVASLFLRHLAVAACRLRIEFEAQASQQDLHTDPIAAGELHTREIFTVRSDSPSASVPTEAAEQETDAVSVAGG